jgi:hypothetical protein
VPPISVINTGQDGSLGDELAKSVCIVGVAGTVIELAVKIAYVCGWVGLWRRLLSFYFGRPPLIIQFLLLCFGRPPLIFQFLLLYFEACLLDFTLLL